MGRIAMDSVGIAERRQQMGRAMAGWATTPGSVYWVRENSWVILSGLPSADVNFALVHGAEAGKSRVDGYSLQW